MAEQLKFPDKEMKVGDTFTQEANLNTLDMPDFGIDTDYPMQVTYKLIAAKDNLAFFDTTSEFNLNVIKEVQGKTVNINGKANGSGKIAVKFNINTDAKYVVNSN